MGSEKFERFDASFAGAGDTLAAALAALIGAGSDLSEATSEALSYLDRCLDAGFRPGMGRGRSGPPFLGPTRGRRCRG
jgi:hydroxymethylpyrimidine/phosphomethylpyrimidine kinase